MGSSVPQVVVCCRVTATSTTGQLFQPVISANATTTTLSAVGYPELDVEPRLLEVDSIHGSPVALDFPRVIRETRDIGLIKVIRETRATTRDIRDFKVTIRDSKGTTTVEVIIRAPTLVTTEG